MFEIKSVNFCFSSACSANCIFCPDSKGRNISERLMSEETFKKVIKKLRSVKFKELIVGENGDLWLNPNSLDFIRELNFEFPLKKKSLFTNFLLFDKEKVDAVLKEDLVDEIHVNIDSMNKNLYEMTKMISFTTVMKNLEYFLNQRRELRSSIHLQVHILNIKQYYDNMKSFLKQPPKKLFNDYALTDDTKQTVEALKKILTCGDLIGESKSCAWAERSLLKNPKEYHSMECPQYNRLLNEVFIAPDGSLYACCLDHEFNLLYGNLCTKNFKNIWFGTKRKLLLSSLSRLKYDEIGFPCSHVGACYYWEADK